MFGNKSLPSRIYTFGASAPVGGAETVDGQMFLARRYRNRLVEIERERREAVAKAMRERCPGLVAVEAEIAAAEGRLGAANAALNAARAAARSRKADPQGAAVVADLKRQLKALRERRKAEKAAVLDVPPALREAEKSAHEARKAAGRKGADPALAGAAAAAEAAAARLAADHAARNANAAALHRDFARIDAGDLAARTAAREASGCYWGNYLPVEQSMRACRAGPPPKFRRWDGTGTVGVQLQGGLSVAGLFAGTDTRLRIDALPAGAFARGAPAAARRTVARVRVGSTEGGGPVWAAFPVTIHRPPPETARVKWAYLRRSRVATREEWELQLVLESAGGWDPGDRAATGAVGVDVGWRLVPAGLRVAYWAGDDGGEGELVLPHADAGRWRKADDLQSLRDRLFDLTRGTLAAWLAGEAEAPAGVVGQAAWAARQRGKSPKERERLAHESAAWHAIRRHWALPREAPPAWWARIGKPGAEATPAQRVAWLRAWKAPGRLAALTLWWRENRFPGDGPAFDLCEAWRRRDRHLFDWQASQRLGAQRWRRDVYRNFAAMLRRRYARVVVEDADWRGLAKLPAPESPEGAERVNDTARYNQRIASPGLLTRGLVESGAVKVPAKDTTRKCADCGHVNTDWPDPAALHQTCGGCGVVFDVDVNAARVLLASGAVVA